MRQVGSSYKTAGGRSCKIRKGNRVSPGVGLVDESKRNCVHGAHKRVFAIGPHVPRIFMQGNTRQKARCSLGSDRGDGISIEPPERPGSVLPFARVVACWIGHPHTGSKRRQEKRRRTESLRTGDFKLIYECQMLSNPRGR